MPSGPTRRAAISASAGFVFLPALLRAQTARAPGFAVTSFARGLENPWGLAFMPDGRALVTERPGRLRVIERDGRVLPALGGTPTVAAIRQGGLLGVALDPAFATNRLVYLSFAEPRGGRENCTSVFRGRLNLAGTALESGQVIFRQERTNANGFHFGSRLVFDRAGHLFVTTGDRWDFSAESQNPASTIAKVLRMTTDGRPPPGNPAETRDGWHPLVWSIGHRNTQGATLHPETGELWIVDHGPRGGDTLHVARAGRNYGWPVISHGTHYTGQPVGDGTRSRDGMEQPLTHWSPTSIAPAGMSFYTGTLFPEWRGQLFIGTLAGQRLLRVWLDGDRYIGEDRMLGDLGHRLRDVAQGPDGALYLLVDAADGPILRLAPPGR